MIPWEEGPYRLASASQDKVSIWKWVTEVRALSVSSKVLGDHVPEPCGREMLVMAGMGLGMS